MENKIQIAINHLRAGNIHQPHLDMAIEALEKQIAKKTINQATWKACPTCQQGIGVTEKTPNPKASEYCYHCGQKLDWD